MRKQITQANHRSDQGSVILAVMVVLFLLGTVALAILEHSSFDRRMGTRSELQVEARNAAESAAEHAVGQLYNRLRLRNDFSQTAFISGADAVTPPAAQFFGGTRVAHADVEVMAGLVQQTMPDGSLHTANLEFIDVNNPPLGTPSELRGLLRWRRAVPVIAKATARLPNGDHCTVYVEQNLTADIVPLFCFAVFYNMDMEYFPGPEMSISGRVHANGNLYLRKQSSSGRRLSFLEPVTASGYVYCANQKQQYLLRSGGIDSSGNLYGLDTTNYTDIVRLINPAGTNYVSLRKSDGSWYDCMMGTGVLNEANITSFQNWRDTNLDTNLLFKSDDVKPVNPGGVGDYVPDTNPYDGVDDTKNAARVLIEPPKVAADTGYDAVSEPSKVSRQAGIYIAVNPSETQTRTARKPDGTTITLPPGATRAFLGDGTEIVLPGQPSYGNGNSVPNALANAPVAGLAYTDGVVTVRNDQFTDTRRTRNHNYGQPRSGGNPYDPMALDVVDIDVTALRKCVDKSVNGLSASTAYATGLPDATNWNNSIFNPSASQSSVALSDANAIYLTNGTPISTAALQSRWNGGVYVEVAGAETAKDSGVRLINGRGKAPSKLGTGAGTGFTLCTNDAVYVLGHFNADGAINSSTDANGVLLPTNSGRAAESGEVPCAIMSDAFTVLSQPVYSVSSGRYYQTAGWSDRLSDLRVDQQSSYSGSWSTTNPSSGNTVDGASTSKRPGRLPWDTPSVEDTNASSISSKHNTWPTELSTAIMTGIVPSNKDGVRRYSGGVHNFPRFLERWSADVTGGGSARACAIRGSMVAMFESRVATQPWSIRVYEAPMRLWGLNDLFRQGRIPPLTPNLVYQHRVNFHELSDTEYEARKSYFLSL